jgi:hypothetical protein
MPLFEKEGIGEILFEPLQKSPPERSYFPSVASAFW